MKERKELLFKITEFFVIKRNITIIQGDSASGKTTLVNMIRPSSGINVSVKYRAECCFGKLF